MTIGHRACNAGLRAYIKTGGDQCGAKPGPVELFSSKNYFYELGNAWSRSKEHPKAVVEYLNPKKQLGTYVNNIAGLRRCILSFDTR